MPSCLLPHDSLMNWIYLKRKQSHTNTKSSCEKEGEACPSPVTSSTSSSVSLQCLKLQKCSCSNHKVFMNSVNELSEHARGGRGVWGRSKPCVCVCVFLHMFPPSFPYKRFSAKAGHGCLLLGLGFFHVSGSRILFLLLLWHFSVCFIRSLL